MNSTPFFVSAVAAGFVLIAVVAYSYLRPRPEHPASLTALLGILGFALIASPNFTSISVSGPNIELSLIREMQARQLETLASKAAEPSKSAPAPAPTALAPRKRVLEKPASDAVPGTPENAVVKTALSEELGDQWLSAFDRGSLELRTLSNAQLLAFNEYVTRKRREPVGEVRTSK